MSACTTSIGEPKRTAPRLGSKEHSLGGCDRMALNRLWCIGARKEGLSADGPHDQMQIAQCVRQYGPRFLLRSAAAGWRWLRRLTSVWRQERRAHV